MIIKNEGSVVVFEPEGDFEYEWLTLNLETEGWQWMGRNLVVDHRMANDIAELVSGAGFVIDTQ